MHSRPYLRQTTLGLALCVHIRDMTESQTKRSKKKAGTNSRCHVHWARCNVHCLLYFPLDSSFFRIFKGSDIIAYTITAITTCT